MRTRLWIAVPIGIVVLIVTGLFMQESDGPGPDGTPPSEPGARVEKGLPLPPGEDPESGTENGEAPAGSGATGDAEAEPEGDPLVTESPFSVSVTVEDGAGRPVRVEVEFALHRVVPRPIGKLETDAKGKVRAFLPEAGSYHVTAIHDRTRINRIVTVDEGSPAATAVLRYPGTASVAGRIVSPHGAIDGDVRGEEKVLGEEALTVELVREERPDDFPILSSPVNEEGAFRVGGLADGTYLLLIRSKFHVERVEVRDGQALLHDVRLPPGSISGRVTERGTDSPAEEVQVVLQMSDADSERMKMLRAAGFDRVSDRLAPDEEGYYAFRNLPLGEYSMFSNGHLYGVTKAATTLTEEEPHAKVDFVMELGAVIKLSIRNAGGEDLETPVCMTSGIMWGFTGFVSGFTPGKQDFVAHAPGYEFQRKRDVELLPGDPNPIDFVLAPAAVTRVRFLDDAGVPIEGVRVSVPFGDSDLQAFTASAYRDRKVPFRETRAEGWIEIRGARAGKIRIAAKKSGYALVDREIELTEATPEISVTMEPAETEYLFRVAVAGVTPGGQAERLGIREGDRILVYDGAPIRFTRELTAAIEAAKTRGAASVKLVVLSGAEKRELTAEPGALGVRLSEVED